MSGLWEATSNNTAAPLVSSQGKIWEAEMLPLLFSSHPHLHLWYFYHLTLLNHPQAHLHLSDFLDLFPGYMGFRKMLRVQNKQEEVESQHIMVN